MIEVKIADTPYPNLRIQSCAELVDSAQKAGYVCKLTNKKSVELIEQGIIICAPEIYPKKNTGVMVVKSVYKHRQDYTVIGDSEQLAALFFLIMKYQKGKLVCNYCKKVFPKGCQITGIIDYLSNI